MEYNRIKLTEVTESQIVDPPKKMLVWDCDPGNVHEADVLAIVNGRVHSHPVITTTGHFRHCAEIPEAPKPRRATSRELSKWLAKGHGECRNQISGCVSNYWVYDETESDLTVTTCVRVRRWEDADWHEPTVDYMGIEQ